MNSGAVAAKRRQAVAGFLGERLLTASAKPGAIADAWGADEGGLVAARVHGGFPLGQSLRGLC